MGSCVGGTPRRETRAPARVAGIPRFHGPRPEGAAPPPTVGVFRACWPRPRMWPADAPRSEKGPPSRGPGESGHPFCCAAHLPSAITQRPPDPGQVPPRLPLPPLSFTSLTRVIAPLTPALSSHYNLIQKQEAASCSELREETFFSLPVLSCLCLRVCGRVQSCQTLRPQRL